MRETGSENLNNCIVDLGLTDERPNDLSASTTKDKHHNIPVTTDAESDDAAGHNINVGLSKTATGQLHRQ